MESLGNPRPQRSEKSKLSLHTTVVSVLPSPVHTTHPPSSVHLKPLKPVCAQGQNHVTEPFTPLILSQRAEDCFGHYSR